MSTTLTEPVESRPWRPESGPRPRVWSWPAGDRPALWVWSCGAWRYGVVMAKHDYADGRVIYKVAVDLDGATSTVSRFYAWPQPGLRRAHGSGSEPSDSGPPILAPRRRSVDSA
ncbi:hypothetical protein AB0F18_16885 [Streptomyces sp. NPDC029216]|uniref:hypothetical protein n=1 Tax=Streptomyces sp. NPDC029216 TaxID=3154701 RepID=UPI0033D5F846